MLFQLKTINLNQVLRFLLKMFLFLLPWQTIWIYREVFVGGVKLEYATLGFYATEILLWAAVIVFVVWYWKKCNIKHVTCNMRFRFTKDKMFVLACLSLISYLFISIIWSIDKAFALQQSPRVMEAFLLFFIFVLGPMKFNEAVKWLALGAVLPSLLGIWQFFSQSTFAFKWLGLAEHIASNPGASVVVGDEIGRWLRAYGPFSHPNMFGGYAVMVIVLVLMRELKVESKKYKVFWMIVNCLIVGAVFFSFSRSALLALMIVILLNCYIATRRHLSHITYHISLIIVVSIILSVLLSPALKVRVLTSSSYEVASVVERASGFNEGWEILKDNLWLGIGAGNYTAYLQKIDPTRQPWEYQPAHNVGLLFLAEMGVVGAVLLFFSIIPLISYLLSHIKNERLEDCKIERFFMSYVLCPMSYFVLAFFDHYLISSYTGLILTGVFWGLVFRSAQAPKGSLLGKVVPNSSTAGSKQLNLSQDF